MLELGAGADGVELVELLPRGDDGDAALGVSNERRNLFAGEGGIDGHVRSANGKRREVGDSPLPAILGDEGDAVALSRSPAEKGISQRTDALVDLVRGDRLPVTEFVLPEDCARIAGRGNATKEIVDGGDGSVRHRVEIGKPKTRTLGQSRVYQLSA